MPITHTTIPVSPAKVGSTEWAEAHTLPTAGEVGALTTASADLLYLTPGSASAIYLLKQDASTTYARAASAVTTAQLSVYITSASVESIYLLKQDASTTYARAASAVTTAQLSVYLTSNSAAAIYLLAQDASTTYARAASAVTTAQLDSYLTSASASAGYASIGAITSVVNITEASADFKYGITKFVTVDVTNATLVFTTLNDLIISCSASTAYAFEGHLIWRSSATTTGIQVLCSTAPTPGMYSFGAQIFGFGADGIAGAFHGYASANADPIICTSANSAPMNYPILISGVIITPSSASRIQIAVASEISNSGIVVRRGSWLTAKRLGAA